MSAFPSSGPHPSARNSLPSRFVRPAILSTALILAIGTTASAQILEADFTGGTLTLCGTTFVCNGAPFASLTWRGPNVSGSFVFDQALIPGAGSGYVNVPLPLDAGEDPLHLVLGDAPNPLTFTAAGGLSGDLVQVQYLNGQFNGFAYFAAFMYDGHEYQLDVQGRTWTIYDRANGVENLSHMAAYGYLDPTLSNVRPYEGGPTVAPEPASIVLLATGLLGIGGVARRRRAN